MTERTPGGQAQYKKLSELLQPYQPEDLLLILDHYEEGLSTTLEALPLADRFDLRVMERGGQIKTRKVPDELVMLTLQSGAWFEAKAHETRQIHLEQTGNITVNAERILSGQDDFAALFAARRKFVTQKLKGQKGRGSAGTAAPASARDTARTSKDKGSKTTSKAASQAKDTTTTPDTAPGGRAEQ